MNRAELEQAAQNFIEIHRLDAEVWTYYEESFTLKINKLSRIGYLPGYQIVSLCEHKNHIHIQIYVEPK